MRQAARALAILALLVFAPIGSAAPFLQAGGGAARTGLIADPGPRVSDFVFVERMPGAGAVSPPLLFGRTAFALTRNENTLVAVGLDDAKMRTVATFTGSPQGFASDLHLIYVLTSADVEAIPPAGGAPLWSTPLPALPGAIGAITCASPALAATTFYAFCAQGDASSSTEGRPFAIAIDVTTGHLLATFDPATAPPDPNVIDSNAQAAVSTYAPVSLTVLPDRVILGAQAATKYTRDAQIWALDRQLVLKWHKSIRDTMRDHAGAGADKLYGPSEAAQQSIPSYITGDSHAIYVAGGHFILTYDPASGASTDVVYLDTNFVPGQSEPSDEYANGAVATNVALTATTILVEQGLTQYAVDRRNDSVQQTVLNADLHFACRCTMLVANGVVYGMVRRGTVLNQPIVPGATVDQTPATIQDRLMATDLGGGELWHAVLPTGAAGALTSSDTSAQGLIEFSLGEGVLAVSLASGDLAIIGRTPASLVPRIAVADAYPAVGLDTSADLSESAAGALGGATNFSATWGDGDESVDQTSPVLHHTYVAPGNYTATFTVANAHGQTATISSIYHVGASPPIEETFVSRALGPQWQNVTFAVIGLAATGVGGLVALLSRRRKRSVLAREMHMLDAARERTRGDEPAWRIHVGEARAHHAKLLRERKIDSGELLVLERHIEVLSATGPVRAARAQIGSLLLDRYRIDRLLGEGGQGRAYLARDETIGRDVVVKAVPTAGLGGQAKRLLLAEARLAGSLDHPNVVRVLDVIDAGAEAYLVMEFVDGGTLRALMARGPMPRRDALRIFRGIVAGLAAAHARGIVHGDIKPENVLLTRAGVPKLADFGTARDAGPDATVAQSTFGTLRYMAPERVRGAAGDARSDTFATCAILVEMLTGKSYLGDAPMDDFQVRAKILAGAAAPALPPAAADLAPLLARGLATDPEARYRSAADLLAALPEGS